ncbi:MAG: hypothetical protein IK134_12050 [Oscillospiraceae bacterium]|nr:hypothetical protein [Oscillospiraceae bacterium]
MKELEFMELLGELPAEYIEAASNPQKKQRRFAWLRYGVPAMAACIAVVIFAAVYPRLKSPSIPSVDSQPDITIVTESGTSDDAAYLTTAPDENETAAPTKSDSQGHRTSMTSTVTEARSEKDTGSTEKTSQNAANPAESDTEHTKDTHTEKSTASEHSTKSSSGTTKTTTAKTTTAPKLTTTAKRISETGSVTSRTTAAPKSTKATQTTTAKSASATSRSTASSTRTTASSTRTTASSTSRSTATENSTRPRTTVSSDTQASSGTNRTTATGKTSVHTEKTSTNAEMTHYTQTSASYMTSLSSESPITQPTTDYSGSGTGPVPDENDRTVTKWQVYNPDYSDDTLDCFWEIHEFEPWGDDYGPIRDFDYDRYDLLVIHLRTHATDADLTEISLNPDDLRIDGMVYRQDSDQTQRHFIFAVPIPKGYTLPDEPAYNFEVTADASYFYPMTQEEPYIWYP